MKNKISEINVRKVSHVTVVIVFQPMLNSGWQIPAAVDRIAYNYCPKQLLRKVPICTALYNEQLISKALRYGTCLREITQIYLPPTRLSTSGMNHTCLYSPTAEHHRTLAY